MDVRPVQPEKADSPILVTLVGMEYVFALLGGNLTSNVLSLLNSTPSTEV
jgi:hypothetical protein